MENQSGSSFLQVKEISTKEERYNPFAWYSKMRREEPVRWDQDRRSWDVFKYEDVKLVLERKELFSSNRGGNQDQGKQSPLSVSLINIDPPKHSQMRALVNKAFTPRAMKEWEPRIQKIVDMLLDEVASEKEFDAVKALTNPLPVMVIAEILGVPIEDQKKFKEWSDWIVAGPKDNSDEEIQRLRENQGRSHRELVEYFEKIIDQKQKEPGDDIISVLLDASIEGERLSREEIIGFSILLLIAGNETTTNLISNTLYCFTEYPAEYLKVKENPDALVPSAIEEVLRFRSPVQAMNRIAKENTWIGSREIHKGESVVAWIGSANRDDEHFEDAQDFHPERKKNTHMAFGKGIHFCLGAPLARMEADIALKEWIKRFPDFERSENFTLEPIESSFVYGLKEFNVRII
ncbi:cytochrome P450 [Metabacillus sp. GX 13764]|uniref:cytochrome P450 n=1 Tax=Metabacillus kandeliae TaxID=2900151 RepID=UPI001E441E43|nr:cytochrome P450 [Metabacillus kandeliae]MCD7035057.1 cytochrome P450 [Metabacillus kandeliae]